MTITLTLSPELEQYLIQEANQHGLSVETVASELLTNSLLARQKQAEALEQSMGTRLEESSKSWETVNNSSYGPNRGYRSR